MTPAKPGSLNVPPVIRELLSKVDGSAKRERQFDITVFATHLDSRVGASYPE